MSSLIQQLLHRAPRFEFYQAVRLLELHHTEKLRHRLLNHLTEIQWTKIQQVQKVCFQLFRYLVEEVLRQQTRVLFQKIVQDSAVDAVRQQSIAQKLERPTIASFLRILKDSGDRKRTGEAQALLDDFQQCPQSIQTRVQEIRTIVLCFHQRSRTEQQKSEKLQTLLQWLQRKSRFMGELGKLLLEQAESFFPLDPNSLKVRRIIELLQQGIQSLPKGFSPLLTLLEEETYTIQDSFFIPEQRLLQLFKHSRGHLSSEERALQKLIRFEPSKSQPALLSQIEQLTQSLYPLAETAKTSVESIRFSSTIRFDFVPSNVEEIEEDPTHDFFQMKVNFMGLGGASCILPEPYQVKAQQEASLRTFLDGFNHRLISLSYRIHSRHRLSLQSNTPEQSKMAEYLFALIGLRTPALRDQATFSDRSLLHYAGILSDQNRSIQGLKQMLTHYIGVPVDVKEAIGRWVPLAESEQTLIGYGGQNQRLGEEAVLGRRVWDQQSMIEFSLGPLNFEQFLMFQPESKEFQVLCDLIRFYLGRHPEFRFVLLIPQRELPPTRLFSKNAPSINHNQLLPRLTRGAWLSNQYSSQLLRFSLAPTEGT